MAATERQGSVEAFPIGAMAAGERFGLCPARQLTGARWRVGLGFGACLAALGRAGNGEGVSIGAVNRPRRRPGGTGDGCGPDGGCYKILQMKCSFCGNGDPGWRGVVPDERTAIAGACRMDSPYHFVEVTAGFGLFRRLKDSAACRAAIAPIDSISGGSSSKITVLSTEKSIRK